MKGHRNEWGFRVGYSILATFWSLILILPLSVGRRAAFAQEPAEPAQRLLSDVENLAGRDGTTREYIRTYELADDVGGTHTIERKLVEKADGLNYDAALTGENPGGPSDWRPTVNELVARAQGGGWALDTGPAKITIADSVLANPLVTYEVPFRSADGAVKSVRLAMRAGVVRYTGPGGEAIASDLPRASWGRAEGNRVLFPDAFDCGDLELVYQNGTLHQNVIVRNRAALPATAAHNLSAEEINVEVHTEITDLSELGDVTTRVNERLDCDALSFADAAAENPASENTPPVVWFDDSRAWSEAAPGETHKMTRRVAAGVVGGGRNHIDVLPLSTILAHFRQLAQGNQENRAVC